MKMYYPPTLELDFLSTHILAGGPRSVVAVRHIEFLAVKSNNYYCGRNGVRPSNFLSLIINS